jgi:hypothetical protein
MGFLVWKYIIWQPWFLPFKVNIRQLDRKNRSKVRFLWNRTYLRKTRKHSSALLSSPLLNHSTTSNQSLSKLHPRWKESDWFYVFIYKMSDTVVSRHKKLFTAVCGEWMVIFRRTFFLTCQKSKEEENWTSINLWL